MISARTIKASRLLSLNVVRGATVALMVLVNNSGGSTAQPQVLPVILRLLPLVYSLGLSSNG